MERIYVEAKAKKSKKPIKEVISKLGIVYPNPSLGFIHARYASFQEKNGNNVLLLDSVKQDVPKLNFTQANYLHRRAGYVLGSILAAWVNEDTNEIEIVFSFYKNLYPKLWEQAQEDLESGELTVSFELMYDQKNLVVENGVKILKRVDFDGVGVLFSGTKPAFKDAHCLAFAMQDIEDFLHSEDKNLIFASVKDIAVKWAKIGELLEQTIQDKQGGNSEMDKKANDALLAKFKTEIIAELGEEAVKEWDDAHWEAELAKRANPEETKEEKADEDKAEETKVEDKKEEATQTEETKPEEKKEEVSEEKVEDKKEEAKSEETKEEKPSEEVAKKYSCECLECGKKVQTTEHCKDIKCPECGGEMRREDRPSKTAQEENAQEVHEKTTETRVYDVIRDDSTNKMEVVETVTTTIERDGKVITDEKMVRETVYSQEQMDAMKAECDAKLVSKDEEIKFVKEHASEIIRIRAEFGDFVKDMSDEDLFNEAKMEIIKLKKENAELKAKVVVTAAEETTEEKKDENIQATETTEEETTEESSAERVKTLVKQRYNK